MTSLYLIIWRVTKFEAQKRGRLYKPTEKKVVPPSHFRSEHMGDTLRFVIKFTNRLCKRFRIHNLSQF